MYICPACLERFAESAIQAEMPECPSCGSEALSIDVIPYSLFMATHSLADIQKRRTEWLLVTGLLPQYHKSVLKRIDSIISEKRNEK